ncbi:MAG TPA: tRNA pseudouridine(55) synthase TruB [Terriglobales bacterium]|nr:tRNA pseudouridine(55) synthase TruB [Terriglobales bacterium]
MDGLLIIDKPAGCTSHDVVLRVRRLLRLRRVGHGGTLDPDATGVLLIALGQATRFFPFLSGEDKAYDGLIRLGYATDTYDASGRPASPDRASGLPTADEVAAAMHGFEGELLQVPPPYSAKKVGGRRAYELARTRKAFSLEPVRVRVAAFTMAGYAPPLVRFEVRCSPGTYVRALAHDLGAKLGCGAHLQELRRTASGSYGLRRAVPLRALEEAVERGRMGGLLVPLEDLLPDAPSVVVAPEAVDRARNGTPLFAAHLAAPLAAPPADNLSGGRFSLFRLLDPSGRLLGLARPSPGDGSLHPFLILR